MSVLHDLYCPVCGEHHRDRAVRPGALPRCAKGHPLRIDWSHGRAPRVDAHEERYCESVDVIYSSRRELERKAAARGWYPAGDPVGGARKELRIRGTIFGGGGMGRPG